MAHGLTRRAFLRTAVAGGAVATVDGAAAQEEGSGQQVAMTDDLVYDPETVSVAPGTTVTWENTGSIGHTVTAYEDEIPEDASYFASGGFDSEDAARSGFPDQGNIAGGETYEHTFETEGTYGYFCIPHEGQGMVGTVEVTENPEEGGGDGGSVSILPDSAKTLAVATTSVLVSVLGLTWVFMKYGGEYGEE